MMPNSAWSGRLCAASERSAQRWVRSVASATSARVDEPGGTGWSKATAMSEPSASWTAIECSGREAVDRAVEVAAERHAVVVDDPQVAERDDLEAAGVGQDRPVPGHEPMQAAEPLDPLVAGPQVEVVRVGQDDRRADLDEVVRVERLDRGVRADRHELRRLDDPVGQRQPPEPRPGRAVRRRRDEGLERRRTPDGVASVTTAPRPASSSAPSHSAGISASARRGGTS